MLSSHHNYILHHGIIIALVILKYLAVQNCSVLQTYKEEMPL